MKFERPMEANNNNNKKKIMPTFALVSVQPSYYYGVLLRDNFRFKLSNKDITVFLFLLLPRETANTFFFFFLGTSTIRTNPLSSI